MTREAIRIGVFESPPLMKSGETGWHGPVIDGVRHLIFPTRELCFEPFTFDDMPPAAAADRFDLFCGLFRSEVRSQALHFYTPLFSIPMVAVNGTGDLVTKADLGNYDVAVQVEGDLGSELLQAIRPLDRRTLDVVRCRDFDQWRRELAERRDTSFTLTDALTVANVLAPALGETYRPNYSITEAQFCLARAKTAPILLDNEVEAGIVSNSHGLRSVLRDRTGAFKYLLQ